MTFFGMILATAGLGLIISGQRMFWIRQMARMRGQRIVGKIVKWKVIRTKGPRSSTASGVMYCPVVTFEDPMGVERTVEISYQYTPLFMEDNPAGSPMTVLFDPMHPHRTLDTTWTMAYFLPVLLSCCGLLILLIGLGIVFGQ